MKPSRRIDRRALTRTGAVMVALVALAGVASTSAAQTQRKVRPRPDLSARPRAAPPTVCQPTWPATLNGIASYYSVVVQLQNCQAADIPLSIDMGPDEGQGTSLKGVGGVDVKGTAVVWDAGTSTGTVNPNAPAVTAIPHGDGQGGVGSLVGFTTVPYWDGNRGDSPGPYANQFNTTDGTEVRSMRGSWALYLPSATFEFDVPGPLPFPFTPQYYESADPSSQPGARFTGVLVTRSRPGELQDPIFTDQSPLAAYGASPPSTSFVPGNCYDPVSIVNGANYGYTNRSNWSFKGNDGNNTWNFTPVSNASVIFGNAFQWPVLMLGTGFVTTNQGRDLDIALRDGMNSATSTTPHYVQLAVRNVNGVDCSGSDKVFNNAVAIGTDLRGINLASAQLSGAVFANSDLRGASLTQTTLAAAGTEPNLSYANLSGTVASQTPAIGANIEGALLIGTNMQNMNLTGASLQNTNLLLANLQGSTGNPNFGNALYCQTTLPNGSTLNDDCNTLKAPQETWQVDTSGCQPLTCVYVSLYNNTTRTLARGLNWCVDADGQFASEPQPPMWIAPLVTGQLGMQPTLSSDAAKTITCAMTFANGAGGKVRVKVDTSSGSVVASVDSGTCFGASSDACLPRSWDGKEAVKVSSHQYEKNGATFFDVIICEPEAFTPAIDPIPTPGFCPTTAALHGLP